VSGNLSTMLRIVKAHTNMHGIESGTVFRPQGPHPVEDTFGMMMDVALLGHSLNDGTNEDHMQFNTISKTRSAISNLKRTADYELAQSSLAGYNLGEIMAFTNTSMFSLWFDHLVVGCHIRMGDDIRSDRSISIELLLEIQR
jgi:hypothetical protein